MPVELAALVERQRYDEAGLCRIDLGHRVDVTGVR
jgi:hypothetical protein